MRNVAEEHVPDLLHGHRYDLDVVLERIILPGDKHHERRNEITTPNLTIDLAWQMFILEFLDVGVHRFGFVFGHKSLSRGELEFSASCGGSAYLAGQAFLAFDGRSMGCVALDASSFLAI
jgi:hypothetical protein